MVRLDSTDGRMGLTTLIHPRLKSVALERVGLALAFWDEPGVGKLELLDALYSSEDERKATAALKELKSSFTRCARAWGPGLWKTVRGFFIASVHAAPSQEYLCLNGGKRLRPAPASPRLMRGFVEPVASSWPRFWKKVRNSENQELFWWTETRSYQEVIWAGRISQVPCGFGG